MRKKALLVGALSPFEGPVVNLEEGTWLVEPPSSGEVRVRIGDEVFDLPLTITGPVAIRAIVFSGEVHVDAKQVA